MPKAPWKVGGTAATIVVASALALSCGPQTATGEGPPEESSARPGRPGYRGSASCGTCHEVEFREWTGSHHARTVHEPSDRERENLRQSLLCEGREARLVLGVRLSRRFLVDSDRRPGMHVLLPCRYDVGTGTWASLHESDWQDLIWEESCGACHTTGFSSEDFSFQEMKVGCEACHGPGARHGSYETLGDMIAFGSVSAVQEVTICASCHLQGGKSRATGRPYPQDYEPGDDLFADYEFDWSALDIVPEETDNPIDVHQKLLIRDLAVPSAQRESTGLRCSSCHKAHFMSHEIHAELERQEYCYLCHMRDGFGVKEYEQSCNVCEF